MTPWRNVLYACIWLGAMGLSDASGTEHAAQRWPAHPVPTKESEVQRWSRAIKLRPSFGACLDAAGGATDQAELCLGQEHSFQDARLNHAYGDLMSRLNERDRKDLRAEERDWMAFRDRYCANSDDSGQQGQLDHDECLVDQTADRATELETRSAQ